MCEAVQIGSDESKIEAKHEVEAMVMGNEDEAVLTKETEAIKDTEHETVEVGGEGSTKIDVDGHGSAKRKANMEPSEMPGKLV